MDKLKQWVALTVVAVLAVLAAGWFLLVSPKRSDAQALRVQADGQQSENNQLRTQLSVLKAQAKDLPKEQARLAAVAAKLPDEAAQPVLLRALAAAATGANVEFVSVTPGPLTPVTAAPVSGATAAGTATAGTPAAGAGTAPATAPGTTSGAATTSATGTTATTTPETGTPATGAAAPAAPADGTTTRPVPAGPAGTLMAMPLTIIVAGSYFDVEQYLAALEDLPRALRVTGLTITPGPNPVQAAGASAAGTTDDGRHLVTTITGTVYVAAGATPLAAVVAPPTPVK